MRVKFIRKFLVIALVTISAFYASDCKKQAKCGCKGDVIKSLVGEQARVYFTDGSTIQFTPLNDPYSQYNFCNPGEMFPKLADVNSGDIMLITGEAFWNCQYAYQASNSYYYSSYRVYDIIVSDVYVDLYGKKK